MDFLEGKWRTWYKNLDVNKDGIVSRQDYETCLGAYVQYYKEKVSSKMLDKMRKGFAVYWEEVILGKIGQKDTVTEEEFIASMIKMYTADRDGFRKMMRYTMKEMIGAADADGNGMITFEEFFVIFNAFGHGNERILKRMFSNYGPTDNGEIRLSDMIDSWLDIVVGEDPNHVNIVIDAFTRDAKPGEIAM